MSNDRDGSGEDGRRGVARVEAFSDGVVAIIVTIMVLELHPPVSEGMDKLWTLWPVFVAYVLSYAYVAIYWVNHHRLFGYATRVTNALLWSNMLLLFSLSLVPFSTAYLGEHHFGRAATLLYLASMLFPAAAYTWVERTITRTGRQDVAAIDYHAAMQRKGRFAVFVYVGGTALTFASPWFGVAAAAIVAVFWFLPASRIDGWFGAGQHLAPRDRPDL